MSVSRTALIVVRILNALMRSADFKPHILSDKFGQFAQKSNLTDDDIKAIGEVLIAIALMTNANVATVRDPSLYNRFLAEKIYKAMSPKLHNLAVDQLGLDISHVASKKHYEIANKIFIDSKDTIITNKDMQDFLGKINAASNPSDLMTDIGKAVKDDKRPDILYRGLKNMSWGVWKLLLDCHHEGFDFDIGNGASSFSRDRSEAYQFVGGIRPILMIVKNPKKKGIPAEKLSHWSEEEETIITDGKIRVDSYKMTGTCLIESYHPAVQGMDTANYTILSDDEITIKRSTPDGVGEEVYKAQTPTSNEEGGAVDGRWFVNNIVSKIKTDGVSRPKDTTVPLFDAKQKWDPDYWAKVSIIKKDWMLIVECTLL